MPDVDIHVCMIRSVWTILLRLEFLHSVGAGHFKVPWHFWSCYIQTLQLITLLLKGSETLNNSIVPMTKSFLRHVNLGCTIVGWGPDPWTLINSLKTQTFDVISVLDPWKGGKPFVVCSRIISDMQQVFSYGGSISIQSVQQPFIAKYYSYET